MKQKRFDEYFAKVVLEYCFPERYQSLQVLDKPDLQSGDIGIEVTSCTPENVREGFVRCRRVQECGELASNCDLERIKQLKAVQITECGLVWNQDTYTENIESSPLQTFIDAVANKVEKLNSQNANYAELKSYDLFVNSALDIAESTGVWKTLSELSFRIAQINTKARKFDFVYLTTINQSIVVFDTNQGFAYIKHLYNRLEQLASVAKNLCKGEGNV